MLAATWMTAIGTAVLAVGAIVTAVFAIRAFSKQSQEVGLLQEQARHEQQDHRQEAEERRWRQAVLVYLTRGFDSGVRAGTDFGLPIGPMHLGAAVIADVHNTSGQPVYDVRVHWVDAGKESQAGAEDPLGTLGPGDHSSVRRTVPDGTIEGEFMPVAYFRDAAGLRWTVTPGGQLRPVPPELIAGAPVIATNAISQLPGPGTVRS
jgi:hypothetical protein